MKSIDDMKGPERAAALLVALGSKTASDILKHLDEDSIQKISLEMAKINGLAPYEKEDLIGEFMIELRRARRSVSGGENKARELLSDAFGVERADEILKKIEVRELDKKFDFLREVDPEVIGALLKNEHPQTIAVAMKYLPPAKAGEILEFFPQSLSRTVGVRLARMKTLSPEAVLEIAKVIKKRYMEFVKNASGFVKAGGVDSLVGILQHMGYEDELNLMSYFDDKMPEVSQELRARIFTFENVLNLSHRDMQILLDEIHDNHMLARALKGAGDDVRFKFFRNMSQNRATDIIMEMDSLGPVRLQDIDEYRQEIAAKIRHLHEQGIISVKKRFDVLVE